MTLTVARLLADRRLGLTLVGGAAGADRPITWAHAIELEDPTPWLSGGELVMTTGLRLPGEPDAQRAYLRRLGAKGATALALDTGTVHSAVPEALRLEGDALGLPVLAVAGEVPFIAIGRAVADALAAADVTAAKRVADQQHRLARAALGGGIPAVVDALAGALEADVVVLDAHDAVLASASRDREDASRAARDLLARRRSRRRAASGVHADADGHLTSQVLGVAGVGRGEVLVGTRDALHATQRLLVNHAVSLIAIELEKPAAVLTVERRLRSAVLRALLSGVLGSDLTQLRYFGLDPDAPVVALAVVDAGPLLPAEELLDDVLAATGLPYLATSADGALIVLLPAEAADRTPEQVCAELRRGLGRPLGGGLGSAAALGEAGTSRQQALAAARAGRGGGRELLRFAELSTYDLLLGGQSREALAAVASAALGPLESYDAARNGELVRSLEAFLSHNGQWEAAAAAIEVHRHTMRNRMAKVAALLGRDVESAHVRAELWLAVKARELVQLGG
ncbi:PucR family transcriptional regulator [Blastococcus xanthinilyticus]|uniref:Purine catabolism regulator n=1 Tax=Blastococcus xanthinilyticus TaxID=1564164 RepID=A0A5S5D1D6_9ACTN|nr:PucR family transcriptional regulator [Blastococcus xanthinilyticus]TYP88592.1 purine catabolism regulator [Blastococcus xanthinilyticus]